MPETAEQRKTRLENRLDEVIQEIEAFNSKTSSANKGAGINTSGDGVNVDHDTYLKTKYEELERLQEQIRAIEGPFIEGLEIW